MMKFADTSRGRPFAKDPAVVAVGGRYLMYYSMASDARVEGSAWGIGIAESHDLVEWTKIGEVPPVGEDEAVGICAPGAIVLDGRVHLFFQTYGKKADPVNGQNVNDSIHHAVSDDGISFVRNATNPVVRAEGDWNNGRAIDADACVVGDDLFLYFATRDPGGTVQMQGVTKAPLDGRFERSSWVQQGDGPILRPELDWEQDCVEAAATIVRHGKVFMFYAGAYNNSPQQIGVAVSTDGVHFERLFDEPFYACGEPGSWNSSESGHPYVFEDDDGRVYLFFQGNDDDGASWYISKIELDLDAAMPRVVSSPLGAR